MFVATARVERGASGGVFVDNLGRALSLIVCTANINVHEEPLLLSESGDNAKCEQKQQDKVIVESGSVGISMGLPWRILNPFVRVCTSEAARTCEATGLMLRADPAVLSVASLPSSSTFASAVWEFRTQQAAQQQQQHASVKSATMSHPILSTIPQSKL